MQFSPLTAHNSFCFTTNKCPSLAYHISRHIRSRIGGYAVAASYIYLTRGGFDATREIASIISSIETRWMRMHCFFEWQLNGETFHLFMKPYLQNFLNIICKNYVIHLTWRNTTGENESEKKWKIHNFFLCNNNKLLQKSRKIYSMVGLWREITVIITNKWVRCKKWGEITPNHREQEVPFSLNSHSTSCYLTRYNQ